jgi:hypothetical protein
MLARRNSSVDTGNIQGVRRQSNVQTGTMSVTLRRRSEALAAAESEARKASIAGKTKNMVLALHVQNLLLEIDTKINQDGDERRQSTGRPAVLTCRNQGLGDQGPEKCRLGLVCQGQQGVLTAQE